MDLAIKSAVLDRKGRTAVPFLPFAASSTPAEPRSRRWEVGLLAPFASLSSPCPLPHESGVSVNDLGHKHLRPRRRRPCQAAGAAAITSRPAAGSADSLKYLRCSAV
ncbi:unnamed protein product [Rangifer tarandus platyrhynchus]|uniref:Uncharacterized protein n=1 Tax=Rangifer tarandus platyrhynchus TaxID=3082113 RepID=A0AC59ZFS3_RANTA